MSLLGEKVYQDIKKRNISICFPNFQFLFKISNQEVKENVHKHWFHKLAATLDVQQCGMCDQQRL